MNERELVVEAKPENIDRVQDFIAEALEAHGYPMKVQMEIAIVTEEIFVNIAKYSYNTDSGKFANGHAQEDVFIRVVIGDDITIEFEDGGLSFNPLEREDPDITLSAEERDIGGLGIFMVKNMMDAVEYRREKNKNILTIKKWKGV